MTVTTRWLSLNDVLEQIPLSRNTVYAALLDGSLAGKKVGNKWIVSQSAVDQWLAPDAEDPAECEPGGTVEFDENVALLLGSRCSHG